MRKQMEVAVYKGEQMLAVGTVKECAKKLQVRPETIKFYLTPSYQRKLAKRKRHHPGGYLTVDRLEDEEV